MITEILVWILFTIFIVWLSAVKTKHFSKERRLKNYLKKFNKLKEQPTITKTLDDKKEYLRQKTAGGKDILHMIISMILFIGAYFMLIHPKIPTFIIGISAAFVCSIILSWVFAKLQFEGIIYELKFVEAFIGYWYASTLLTYIKFLDIPNTLLFVIGSIIIMVIVNKPINRLVNNVA